MKKGDMRRTALSPERILVALGCLVWIVVTYILLFASPRWSLQTLAGDDAGYYLAIARNAVLGHGYSFDRLHETNGFNPLLAWILIGVFKLLPGSLPVELCYRAGVVIGIVCMAGGCWAFLRAADILMPRQQGADRDRGPALAAAFVFYSLFIVPKSYYGMDAPLVLMLGGIYFWRLARYGVGDDVLAALGDGALLGLAFLARVDSAMLVAAALAVMGLRSILLRRGAGSVLLRLAACGAIAAPYLVWSHRTFGGWMPISARLKSSFPDIRLHESLRAVFHTSLNPADLASFAAAFVVSAITVAVIGASLVRGRGRDWLEAPRIAITISSLYVFGRLTFLLVFSRFDVQGSYVILAHTYVVLTCLYAAGWARASLRGVVAERSVALATAGLVIIGLALFAGKVHTTVARWRFEAQRGMVDEMTLGRRIQAVTAPGSIIYGGAYGLLGFFADRPWINGDGVANNLEYQEALHRDELQSYLQANGVRYLAFFYPSGVSIPEGKVELTAESRLLGGIAHYRTDARDVAVRVPTFRSSAADFCLIEFAP